MSREILVANNLGKAYRNYSSEMKRFARWFGVPVQPLTERWVLRHVGFRMLAGESIGIVGQNGAGKSTLLKLIAGTTRATEGNIAIGGKVSALLELGLGFNPELTGRENARHVMGMMGIPADRVESLLPQIEAFAEIGEYLDQPVREYSSGMQMRVAFSVATVEKPDILIVDEALSVGDAYFVHKSFQRIRELNQAGTALLVVSHDASAIQAICDRAILLEQGQVMLDSEPKEVLDYYNALIAQKENSTVTTSKQGTAIATESGTREAVFESVELLDADGNPVEYVAVGDRLFLRCKARLYQSIPHLVFGYMIRDRLGQPVYGTNTHHTQQALSDLPAESFIEFVVDFVAGIGPGTYSVSVALSSTETHLVKNYQWKDLALVFTVANVSHSTFVGVAHLPPTIRITTGKYSKIEAER